MQPMTLSGARIHDCQVRGIMTVRCAEAWLAWGEGNRLFGLFAQRRRTVRCLGNCWGIIVFSRTPHRHHQQGDVRSVGAARGGPA